MKWPHVNVTQKKKLIFLMSYRFLLFSFRGNVMNDAHIVFGEDKQANLSQEKKTYFLSIKHIAHKCSCLWVDVGTFFRFFLNIKKEKNKVLLNVKHVRCVVTHTFCAFCSIIIYSKKKNTSFPFEKRRKFLFFRIFNIDLVKTNKLHLKSAWDN